MRPWQHARASAARGGRAWSDDLPIHEFVDRTKASLADLRHRMILHNSDLGPALAARAFAALAHAEEVARAHAREDLGAHVPLSWWLDQLEPARLPRRRDDGDDGALIARATAHFGLDDDAEPRAVHALLTLPERFAPAHAAASRAVLCNDAGISIVRAVLGTAREVPTRRARPVVFDPAWCAEAMVMAWFRQIPSLANVADALRADTALRLDELRRPSQHNAHTFK
jgi:hypothetical protein